MGIRELIESAVGPSLEELRAAGVREVHLQPEADGGAIGIAGEGFSLLLHAEGGQPSFAALLGVSDATPSLAAPGGEPAEAPDPSRERPPVEGPPQDAPDGAGALEADEEGAGSGVSRRAPASATEPAHSSAPSRDPQPVKRCGGTYGRHSWTPKVPKAGEGQACEQCGVPRPSAAGAPTPTTTRGQLEAFRLDGSKPAPAPDSESTTSGGVSAAGGVRQRHDLQPHNPGRCPRCGRPITRAETPRGARWECDAVPRGCGWREWTWVAA